MDKSSVGRIASVTTTAEQLLRIWAEVLQTAVSPDQNFIDMGGDSLSAMSCIVRMRGAFSVEFTVEDFLMEDATVDTFAGRIDRSA